MSVTARKALSRRLRDLAHRTSDQPVNVTSRPARAEIADDGRGVPQHQSDAHDGEIEMWARGGCHAFALAMHAQHGWPMRILGQAVDKYTLAKYSDLIDTPRHVYCIRDDGRPVDVHGVFADEAAIQKFFLSWADADEIIVSEDITDTAVRDLPHRCGYAQLTDTALLAADRAVTQLSLDTLGR